MFINKPLTDYDITNLAKELKIKNFTGVFMRDTLLRVNDVECGVVNLDTSVGNCTYWACYYKNNLRKCYYLRSFGLDPPIELRKYLMNSGNTEGKYMSTRATRSSTFQSLWIRTGFYAKSTVSCEVLTTFK